MKRIVKIMVVGVVLMAVCPRASAGTTGAVDGSAVGGVIGNAID